MPMTPFIGVRISWLMLARNSLLARLAARACSLATWRAPVRSRTSSSRVRRSRSSSRWTRRKRLERETLIATRSAAKPNGGSETGPRHDEPGKTWPASSTPTAATSASPPRARVRASMSPRHASRAMRTTASARSGSSQSERKLWLAITRRGSGQRPTKRARAPCES